MHCAQTCYRGIVVSCADDDVAPWLTVCVWRRVRSERWFQKETPQQRGSLCFIAAAAMAAYVRTSVRACVRACVCVCVCV
jgi:hypothetical protein